MSPAPPTLEDDALPGPGHGLRRDHRRRRARGHAHARGAAAGAVERKADPPRHRAGRAERRACIVHFIAAAIRWRVRRAVPDVRWPPLARW